YRQQGERAVELEGTRLDMAARRPQERLGPLSSVNRGRSVPHKVTEVQLQDPVEALDDGNAGPQQHRLIAVDQDAVRGIAAQRGDEALDREQDIDDVRVALLADER